jgi:hypothetical protein
MRITITEALAEVKTISKRLEAKQKFVLEYLTRPENEKDPLEKDGGPGSAESIVRARQAIHDLQERLILIRSQIHKANLSNNITIGAQTRSISDWLAWKREVYEGSVNFLSNITQKVSQQGRALLNRGGKQENIPIPGVVININPTTLAQEVEEITTAYETLDGQLSLKNATITIELPD